MCARCGLLPGDGAEQLRGGLAAGNAGGSRNIPPGGGGGGVPPEGMQTPLEP